MARGSAGGGRGGGGSSGSGRGGGLGGQRGFSSSTGGGNRGRGRGQSSRQVKQRPRQMGGFYGYPFFGPRRSYRRPPLVSRPVIINQNQGQARQNKSTSQQSSSGGSSSGCLALIGVLIVFGLALFLISSIVGGPSFSSDIQASTVEREPLPLGAVEETAYYTDTAGWIDNPRELESGMQHFYQETGVQPHLYTDDERPQGDPEEIANNLYDELFEDEAHLLVYFYDEYDGQNYGFYILTGRQAKQVVDQEAVSILDGYINRYYEDQSLSVETAFSKAFEDSADRMMQVTRSPWPIIIGILGIALIIYLVYSWWKRKKEEEARQAELTKEILSQPLQTFQDQEFQDLVNRYEEKDASELEERPTSGETSLEDPNIENLKKKYGENQGGKKNG